MTRTSAKSASPRTRPTTERRARLVEVFFEDAATFYDAPLEDLWEFMLHGGEIHGSAHTASLRNFKGVRRSATCFEATYEEWVGGRWSRCRSRHTSFRPICKIDEHLEGDYAGTVVVFRYWPAGRRTRVDVSAVLRSEVLSAGELRAHWRDDLARNFEEDAAVLPRFLKQQGRG